MTETELASFGAALAAEYRQLEEKLPGGLFRSEDNLDIVLANHRAAERFSSDELRQLREFIHEQLKHLQSGAEETFYDAYLHKWAQAPAEADRPERPQPPAGLSTRLSAEERERLANDTASTINHALAMLFLRLGPPPAGVGMDGDPVTADGGGVRQ